MGYWQDRIAQQQQNYLDMTVKQLQAKETKLYTRALEQSIKDFESTYNSILAQVEKGEQITPARIYSLDRYWEQNAELQARLKKLGNSSYKAMLDAFIKEYAGIYNGLVIPYTGGKESTFNKVNHSQVKEIIENNTLFPDGKKFSDRIWSNMSKLQDSIDENFINCLLTGKNTNQFGKVLRKRFGVSYSEANRLIRTESAAIMTQASVNRYKDTGINRVQFWADPDERTCEVCGKLHEKEFDINQLKMGVNLPPLHPNDRCCIIPVV